jgi:hypothetical protein
VAKDDKVLSQAEIDTLLASSLDKGNTPENKKPALTPVKQPDVKAAPLLPKAAAPPLKTPQTPAKAATAAIAAPAAVAHTSEKATPVIASPAATAPRQNTAQGPTMEQVSNLCRQLVAQETKDLSKQLVELTIQVNRYEKTAQKMAGIEEKLNQVAAMVQSSPKTVKALGTRIDEIYELLETMRRPGRKSEEDRIHDDFHCVKCQSEKLVAIHVKCTGCGTENWMGWFPESR